MFVGWPPLGALDHWPLVVAQFRQNEHAGIAPFHEVHQYVHLGLCDESVAELHEIQWRHGFARVRVQQQLRRLQFFQVLAKFLQVLSLVVDAGPTVDECLRMSPR